MPAAVSQASQITQQGGEALAVQCDVTDSLAQAQAFAQHMHRWGRLDYALLNAGIAERGAQGLESTCARCGRCTCAVEALKFKMRCCIRCWRAGRAVPAFSDP